MKKKAIILVMGFVLCLLNVQAQKPRWSKGEDLKFLEGQKSLRVVISYDSMTMENGKSVKEYQEEVAKSYDAESPGKGKKYLDRWEYSKDKVFPEHLMKSLKHDLSKADIDAGFDIKGNKYLLKVYPLAVTPGAPTYPGKRGAPAYTDFRMVFVEEANPTNVLASAFIYQVKGVLVGHDFDMTFIGRFKNCFWFGGASLGNFMVHKIRDNK